MEKDAQNAGKINLWLQSTVIILAVVLGATIWQSYQIFVLSSDINKLSSGMGDVKTRLSSLTTTNTLTSTGSTGTSSASTSRSTRSGSSASLQEILTEITPTGTPDYGTAAGVSYDGVEAGLRTLVGYHSSISLSGDDQVRYISIATAKGTACEFCCGIGEAGFGRSDGKIACGCSHNIAFSGITKWLIQNTDYTNDQIIEEIGKWKILFFPQGAVEKELAKRNINPQSVGLPAMRGGC